LLFSRSFRVFCVFYGFFIVNSILCLIHRQNGVLGLLIAVVIRLFGFIIIVICSIAIISIFTIVAIRIGVFAIVICRVLSFGLGLWSWLCAHQDQDDRNSK